MFPIYLCLGFIYLFFQFYHIFTAQSNNIYHKLYDMMFEINRHQPFNQCSLFFGFFVIISLPYCCCCLFSLYSSSSFFFVDFTFSIESYQLVRDVSSLSVLEVYVVSWLSSFASFLNYLNLGGNGGTCGGRHWYFVLLNYLYPDLGLDPFLMDTYLVIYIYFLYWNAFFWYYTCSYASC